MDSALVVLGFGVLILLTGVFLGLLARWLEVVALLHWLQVLLIIYGLILFGAGAILYMVWRDS